MFARSHGDLYALANAGDECPCLLSALTAMAQGQTATVRVQVPSLGEACRGGRGRRGRYHPPDRCGWSATIITGPGTVEITVVKPGFATATASVEVAAGATQEVLVDLAPQPAVEETVTVGRPLVPTRARESTDAGRSAGSRGNRGKDAHDARRHRHDAERNRRHAGAGDLAVTGAAAAASGMRAGIPVCSPTDCHCLVRWAGSGCADSADGPRTSGGHQRRGVGIVWRRGDGRRRQPCLPASGREPEREFLLNRSTRGATDAVTFLSGPLTRGWSASLLGGGHWQETNDVNGDAWRISRVWASRDASTRVLGWRQRSDVLCDHRVHVRGPRRRHAQRVRC